MLKAVGTIGAIDMGHLRNQVVLCKLHVKLN